MSRGRLPALVGPVLVVAAALVVGCGATDVPPEAQLLVDPVPPLPEEAAPAAGAAVFGRYCAACHGSDGGGDLGPDLTEGPLTRSYDRVRDVVEGGRAPMPAFGQLLDDDELRDVSAYVVQALRAPGGSSAGGQASGGGSPKAPEQSSQDSSAASAGAATYDVYCAGCHGADLGGTPLGPPIDVTADGLATSVASGGNGMPAFRQLLPGGQIEGLVAYLRSDPVATGRAAASASPSP